MIERLESPEGRTRRALERAAAAAVPHGVTALGACVLPEREKLIHCRALGRIPAGGSAVVMLLPYHTGEHPGRNVARYAVCDDYHTVAGEILEDVCAALREEFPGARFLPFADSSPVPEVEAACRAGLGRRGRNGQLIAPVWGSRVFVCEVVTDLELVPTGPLAGSVCGNCRRCLEACPTGALTAEGLDRSRCRSFITQKKGALEPWEEEQVAAGGMAWGCDICTDVCPWNREPPMTPILRLRENLTPVVTAEELEALMARKSYGWRGRQVLERNLKLVSGAAARVR